MSGRPHVCKHTVLVLVTHPLTPSSSIKFNSFWENIILARDLEVLKSIYLFRLTFQTNTVRHQNITKLKCQDVKLDQLSRCHNEKVRVKTANNDCTTNKCWGEKGGKDNIGLQIPGSKSWTHKCKGQWRINYWGPPSTGQQKLDT